MTLIVLLWRVVYPCAWRKNAYWNFTFFWCRLCQPTVLALQTGVRLRAREMGDQSPSDGYWALGWWCGSSPWQGNCKNSDVCQLKVVACGQLYELWQYWCCNVIFIYKYNSCIAYHILLILTFVLNNDEYWLNQLAMIEMNVKNFQVTLIVYKWTSIGSRC